MPITEAMRERRREYIGSSDSAAIMGQSPFATPTDIFYSKRPDVLGEYERPTEDTSTAKEMGNYAEDMILNYAAADLNAKLKKNQFRVSKGKDGGIMAANFDALVKGAKEAVEAKCVATGDEWGEKDTDQIPAYYLIQCQHQMHVGELDRVWVYAFQTRFNRPYITRYRVERNQELIDRIVEFNVHFWDTFVLKGEAPTDIFLDPPVELLKCLKRAEGKTIKAIPELVEFVESWASTNRARLSAEKLEKFQLGRILSIMGDAEILELPDGTLFTYKSQSTGKRLKTSDLRTAHPAIFDEFAEEGTTRVARIQKAPKGKKEKE